LAGPGPPSHFIPCEEGGRLAEEKEKEVPAGHSVRQGKPSPIVISLGRGKDAGRSLPYYLSHFSQKETTKKKKNRKKEKKTAKKASTRESVLGGTSVGDFIATCGSKREKTRKVVKVSQGKKNPVLVGLRENNPKEGRGSAKPSLRIVVLQQKGMEGGTSAENKKKVEPNASFSKKKKRSCRRERGKSRIHYISRT